MKVTVLSSVFLSFCALLFLVFGYSTVLYTRFTPVFRTIQCTTLSSDLGDMTTDDDWVNVSGVSTKTCRNDNVYDMHFVQRQSGAVFIKQDTGLKQVGESTVAESTIPIQGNGTLQAVINISLPFMEAFELMSLERVQVVTKITLQAEARIHILGFVYPIMDEQSKVCGFELQMATQRVGLAQCAATLEELVIPDVDSEEYSPDTMGMSPEYYAEKSHKKDLAFGLLMGFTLALALVMLACGLRAMRGPKAAPDEARQVKIADPVKQSASENVQQDEQDVDCIRV
mmetsp:Transcript_43937/g.125769  ORF Transcript_43937/g.125769 Transcript_43937/m.125769 type:complete len:285 (+) Transcript_43937:63-917(+)|eukprot:CAMPEP_0177180364 /NCGR_PEP_ID=MMETSP0367-20130122/15354_1 /TAXON_ID=447022 ORGANISM="Scrippsiella hangoei-like, Strain SHHI-4" /NCGR_SAMPLE_ID=MMETSP0367 /ASSEMBLY_ACC=CAM_ASM_000362 /LENGTH=284 /DNA_ID=CAMNT_0018627147 /DNA_START=71 /DNA_END=925 /DNA_ORIENTATION=+